jgi:hypothetical protein
MWKGDHDPDYPHPDPDDRPLPGWLVPLGVILLLIGLLFGIVGGLITLGVI